MLSPPYSPFPEKEHQAAAGVIGAAEPNSYDRSGSLPRAPQATPTPTQSDSATAISSFSASGDDLTDNDDSSEESSGSVPLDRISRESSVLGSNIDRKRAASEAFGDDGIRERSHSIRQRRMTTCWDALKSDPARYLRQERSLLGLYPLRRHSWAGSSSSIGNLTDDGQDSAGSAHAVARRGGRPRRATSGTGSGTGSGLPNRRGRRAAQTESDGGDDLGEEQSPKKGSQVRVHDLSLNQIEDFSPPLTTLPPGKSLRAEWKGAPMDLSNDPDLHLLHPAEAHLASVLRLPCEVYLDSKRRLFAEKVHRLRQGLPFRRTDSQKACRIDVNKASRLFGAFERIGWLDDALFRSYAE